MIQCKTLRTYYPAAPPISRQQKHIGERAGRKAVCTATRTTKPSRAGSIWARPGQADLG